MEFKDLKIIIPACDKYMHAVEGLMYTLDKYFNIDNKIILLGYSEPKFKLSDNWEFISLGVDTGAGNWSNDLLKFFETFKDEYFINMIEDALMTRPAKIDKIKMAFDYMLKNREVKKVFLHGSLTHHSTSRMLGGTVLTPVAELNNEFYDVNQISNYRSSLQSAIWNRDYFLTILKPNHDPWMFETQHVKNDGARILTTVDNHPIMFSHLYIKGVLFHKWNQSIYEEGGLSNEETQIIKKMLNI
jgi:hypothetical protein